MMYWVTNGYYVEAETEDEALDKYSAYMRKHQYLKRSIFYISDVDAYEINDLPSREFFKRIFDAVYEKRDSFRDLFGHRADEVEFEAPQYYDDTTWIFMQLDSYQGIRKELLLREVNKDVYAFYYVVSDSRDSKDLKLITLPDLPQCFASCKATVINDLREELSRPVELRHC